MKKWLWFVSAVTGNVSDAADVTAKKPVFVRSAAQKSKKMTDTMIFFTDYFVLIALKLFISCDTKICSCKGG